ncbi:MAG TPA: hypothetical protein PKI15_10905, partial [Candidatus Cloacimonadota bacterium]|nr:hypothetical protein [Candidatus Cloacimonadota bacterium]
LGALRVFSTGNAYVEEMLATEAEIDDLKLKGQTSAALQEKLDLATGMVLQTRAAYENIKGQAGRILNNAREEKGKAVKMFTEIITRIDNEENAIYEEIRQMQAEIDELTKAMDELDGYIAELEKVVEDAIIKPNEKIIAQAEKLLADARNKAVTAGEELAAMRSTRDALSRRVSTRTMEVQSLIDKIKITEERKAEAEKIIDKLNPRSKKPKTITEVELPRPGLTDYVRSVWYNWILSGPVTHAVNIGANLFNAGIEQVIVNTLSDPRGGVSSVKKSILNIPEAMGFNNKPGEMQGFAQTLKNPMDYKKKYQISDSETKLMKLIGLNLALMSAEDQFFFFTNFKAQLMSLAYLEAGRMKMSAKSLYNNPTPDMITQATYEARRMSFNQSPEGIVGAAVKLIDDFYKLLEKKGGGIGKTTALGLRMWVMPFTRIVGNVANTMIDWTPFGIVKALEYASKNPDGLINTQRNIWKTSDGKMKESPYRLRDAHRQLSRAVIGTILMSALMALAMSGDDDEDKMGIISGDGPKDYEKKRQLMALGWMPNAIRIGNRWIPYQDSPVQGALAIVGNVHDYYAFNEKAKPMDIMGIASYAVTGI